MKFPRITTDPKELGGIPCIRGLRITVSSVVGMIAEGLNQDEILRSHPELDSEDIRQALCYAALAVMDKHTPLSTATH